MILEKSVINTAIHHNLIYSPDGERFWKQIQRLVENGHPLTEIHNDLCKARSNLRLLGADTDKIRDFSRRYLNNLRDLLVGRIEKSDPCVITVCELPVIRIIIDQVEVQGNTVFLATLNWTGKAQYPPEQLSPYKIAEQAIKMLNWDL